MDTLMRKLTLIITLATLGLATPVASAAIRCPSVYPQADFPLHASGTTCHVARDVERHAGPVVESFRVDGYTWRGVVYSRAHNHTYFRFTGHRSGHTATVWITNRFPVS
jgi:hypothetical protein